MLTEPSLVWKRPKSVERRRVRGEVSRRRPTPHVADPTREETVTATTPTEQVVIEAERRVVVSATHFVELLVSRRNLERVGRAATELHDRETNETFVLAEDSRSRAALHARAPSR